MTDIESLRRLTEAVETAGADIAPTYAEYVQLAFAIATDCGEAGRENVPQGVTYGNSDAFAVRISSELRTCSVRTLRFSLQVII